MDGGSSSLKAIAVVLIIGLAALLYAVVHHDPAPTLVTRSPAPGASVPVGAYTVAVDVRGLASIADAHVRIDGHLAAATMTKLDDERWRIAAQEALAPGPHEAEVAIEDGTSHARTYHWSFAARAAPVTSLSIADAEPAPGSVLSAGAVQLGVTVVGPAPVAAASLAIGMRSLPLQLAPPPAGIALSRGQRLVARTTLQPGRYRLSIAVHDAQGGAATYDWTISVVPAGELPSGGADGGPATSLSRATQIPLAGPR